MTAKPMSEEQMVHLVRNALLVAGQEMGNGDQWPVVKDTVYKIMKDFEDLKTERNVDAELKQHIYAELKNIQASLSKNTPEIRAVLEPKFKELCEAYDAHFSPLDKSAVEYDEQDAPEHVKRMKAILATMEENNE